MSGLTGVLVVPLVGGTLALLASSARVRAVIVAATALAAATLGSVTAAQVIRSGSLSWGPFAADALSVIGLVVTAIVVTAVVIFRLGSLEPTRTRGQDGLSIAILTPAHVVFLGHDLTLIVAGVTLTAFAAGALVAARRTPEAIVAGWNLLVATLLASGLTLLASMLAEGETAVIALPLAVAGLGLMAGLPPLSRYMVAAHGESQPSVRALLSGVVPVVAIVALVRFIAATSVHGASQVLLLAGAASAAAAALAMARSQSVSHLLAHSTAQQVGVVLFALGAGATGVVAGLLHMATHAVAKTLAFLAGGALVAATDQASPRDASASEKRPNEVIDSRPTHVARVAFVGAILALVGVPPCATFVSLLLVLRAGLGHSTIAGGVILVALGVAVVLLVASGQQAWGAAASIRVRSLTTASTAVLLVLGALLVVFGIYLPTLLNTVLESAATVATGAASVPEAAP